MREGSERVKWEAALYQRLMFRWIGRLRSCPRGLGWLSLRGLPSDVPKGWTSGHCASWKRYDRFINSVIGIFSKEEHSRNYLCPCRGGALKSVAYSYIRNNYLSDSGAAEIKWIFSTELDRQPRQVKGTFTVRRQRYFFISATSLFPFAVPPLMWTPSLVATPNMQRWLQWH